jgi:hypothetical protein
VDDVEIVVWDKGRDVIDLKKGHRAPSSGHFVVVEDK